MRQQMATNRMKHIIAGALVAANYIYQKIMNLQTCARAGTAKLAEIKCC